MDFASKRTEIIRNTRQIDIEILDISLKEDGIDKVILQYNSDVPIIFVEEYDKNKSYTWDLMAVGSVEKPAKAERFEFLFLRAVNLVKEML